jgi:hypothetical protein
MRKFRVQEKLNALNNIPNPGTVLNRATSLQDIVAELEKHLPAPPSPATSTPTPPPPPPPIPSGGPSGGPRFPVGSLVYVDQGHGQESLGYVATYNAAKGVYVVEIGARGSGVLEICSDKDLRNADGGPLSQLIDHARDKVGSLFGVTPFVMEREGATTGYDAASKPTPQPPASSTKPTPQPPAQPFKLNERVKCRDRGKSWQVGTVVSVEPLKVKPDGATWTAGYAWDEVRVLSPPPPGLKLEGGSLPGEAAKYPGTYRLVVGKIVNGRHAYQHTSDATRWITFTGNGWIGQPESSLGKGDGNLYLDDPAAASPDVSTMTWKASGGGAGAEWVEAPQLKCIAWTPPPPPPGLKLEGGSLEGDAAEYMGGYRLAEGDGKLVNGRPAYQQVTMESSLADGSRWIAFNGGSWMGQQKAFLGKKIGTLELPDEAAATPDASAATWRCDWAAQPQLKCIPWTPPPPPPPPPGLKLEGVSLPGAAAEYIGEYSLYRKLINGRPVWRHTAHFTCWLAFDGAIWRGQPEADLGKKRGVLQLPDTAALTPDASASTWLAETGSGLAAQPQLKCIPCTPSPPPGLKLEGGSLPGDAAKYMGGYRLDRGMSAYHGRPAYQQMTLGSSLADGSRWITFHCALGSWICGHENTSCSWSSWKSGLQAFPMETELHLQDAAAATPDVSSATWKAWTGSGGHRIKTGSGWAAQPQLKCIPWTPPPLPPGLKLEGGSLTGAAGKYMGEYRLAVDDRVWPPQAGKAGRRGGPMLVNGRPAWRHTTHLTCWLAFDGANWRLQPEASLGQERGVLLLPDAAAWSPDASSATWLAASGPGSAGAAQPHLKCIPCAAPPLSRVELEELPVKNFRGPCAACCKPLAPCCCVSADGEAIFGCVPTEEGCILPACLHMTLCPQLGCDPMGGFEDGCDPKGGIKDGELTSHHCFVAWFPFSIVLVCRNCER